ncbi:diaminopimelate decarboxylase [Terribacillus saccharophilus]|uniref:diaminopimelate decarboxylase n=1 Tax=Terribacillus saccharophilus TaxID=361277 RepID=UPI003981A0E6
MQHPFVINDQHILEIGGIDAVTLAKKYGTPLFVYDVGVIRKNAKAFVEAFETLGVKAQVAYASKAFSSVAMVQVAKQEKLSLDVVSQGELHTALKAGFPTEKIHLHGNNKSYQELSMAVEHDIGCVVVDNFHEIDLLEAVLKEQGKQMDILLRVTPGIEAHTHDYILTGNEDSKFGFDIGNGQAEEAFRKVKDSKVIRMKGLHCHIGSQIFETDGFLMAVGRLFELIKAWQSDYGYAPSVLNVGGGFGIRYTENDEPLPLSDYIHALVTRIKAEAEEASIEMPEIWIEPGRSIVGNAAVTLYTIGSVKEIPGVRKYVSVDGGMTDNLRPALYKAVYEAKIANRADEEAVETVSIAGKCCESGDMLIWDIDLPKAEAGDLLAVFSTGAYGYAMANNYNRFGRPAVVFVENGVDRLVVRREEAEELTRLDLSYE